MEQYYICVVLIVFLFLLFFHEIIRDYKSIKHPFRRILLCLVLTLVFKYNYGIFFYGLEYEDAYVFSFCARQFSYELSESIKAKVIKIGLYHYQTNCWRL